MTRRNNKRNNRRNPILGKGVDMIAKKMAENNEETPDIHAEGISNQDVININNGKATLSKLRIPSDGSAVEYPIPDNLQFFFDEEGKLMVRQKTEHETAPDDKEGNPITYDDICKELFLTKKTYWIGSININTTIPQHNNYKDIDNCTSIAQAKRMIAFNKLQNIAKYLNDGWCPDFCNYEKKWAIVKEGGNFYPKYNQNVNDGSVYFKSEELTNEAIRLMGEESLNDLFSTDW